MARKKWTARTDTTRELIQTRLRRKWQIAFRRYIMRETQSASYAHFFGLDVNSLRSWIETQFHPPMSWENFSDLWQFDHLVPVSLFDFELEADLRLCWNFINIRPKALLDGKGDLIGYSVKDYFLRIEQATGYQPAKDMVRYLDLIQHEEQTKRNEAIQFLISHESHLKAVQQLDSTELNAMNAGKPLDEIIAEQDFLKKYG